MKIAEGRKADIAKERNCLLQSKGAVKIGVFLPIIYLEMGEKQVLSKSLIHTVIKLNNTAPTDGKKFQKEGGKCCQ